MYKSLDLHGDSISLTFVGENARELEDRGGVPRGSREAPRADASGSEEESERAPLAEHQAAELHHVLAPLSPGPLRLV